MKIADLESKIGGVTGIPWSVAYGNRRTPSVVRARWIMLYCLDALFPWMSLQEMASIIGRDCHGTAIHGLRRSHELYMFDKSFRKDVDAVLETE